MTEYRDRYPDACEVDCEVGRAVLLPGRRYRPGKPLLDAVADVLLSHGWAVRVVRWQLPDGLSDRQVTAWVADQARTAADGWADRPLLVGKSLGTRAATYAAKERLPAIWLTPLLLDRAVVRGIRRNRARQLLIGGTADTIAWDGPAARSSDAELLELPGADHSLVVRDDVERTAAYRERLREAVAGWLPDPR